MSRIVPHPPPSPSTRVRLFARRLDGACAFLFADGWRFFLPYLALYLLAWQADLPVAWVRVAFLALHTLFGLLLLFHAVRRWQQLWNAASLYWLALAAFFFFPGAFLEFPSDGWEHFRRIFSWQVSEFLTDNVERHRFAYFWGFTLIGDVPIDSRRLALAAYGAFWQLLLAWQLFLLARQLGLSAPWARIQVLAAVCLFGHDLLSFFRYYALAATPLAYVAYLRAISLLVDVARQAASASPTRWLRWGAELLCLLLLITFNHRQELLLLGIAAIALGIAAIGTTPTGRRALRFVLPIAVVLALTSGGLMAGGLYPILDEEGLESSASIAPFHQRLAGSLVKLPQTLGLHGLLALVLAALPGSRDPAHPRRRQLALLTLVPAFAAVICGTYPSRISVYGFRLLFAFPSSFFLVEVMRRLSRKVGRRAPLIATVVVIALGLVPNYPWRGRLWHGLYRPEPRLALEPVDAAADWLSTHRSLGGLRPGRLKLFTGDPLHIAARSRPGQGLVSHHYCFLMSDALTSFAIAAQLGMVPVTERRSFKDPEPLFRQVKDLETWLDRHRVCALILSDLAYKATFPTSLLGPLSDHFSKSLVRSQLYSSKTLRKRAEELIDAGWRRTFVPPHYWLLEPPDYRLGDHSRFSAAPPPERAGATP